TTLTHPLSLHDALPICYLPMMGDTSDDRHDVPNEIPDPHSFHTLLGDLATLTRNVVRLGRDHLTAILATPTQTQRRALDLLGLRSEEHTSELQSLAYLV